MQFKKTMLAAAVVAALPATAGAAVLEEVVVTATKRTESLQDVSMAITAIGSEQITRVGANDFTDLATTVPSLALRSAGPGRTKLNIRGVSAATGFAPTVSFYLDEMPIQTLSSSSSTSFQQSIIDPKLYDLDRIEVLRGPQGTLYGSSSMGGTVRLITKQPQVGQDEGSVNFDISDTEEGALNWRANAMANIGTGDNGALRAVVSYTDADGYMDRISASTGETFAEDVNTEETTTIRLAYRYEFENAYVQPSVMYQKTEMDGKPLYNGPEFDYEQERKFDAAEPFDDDFTLYNLTYGHDLGGMDLLVSASYLERDFENVEDITDVYDALLSEDLGIPSTEANFADETNDVEDTTLEARLSSSDNESINWLVGVFYKDAETDSGYRMQRGFPLEVNPSGLANSQDKRTYEEAAVFGELTWDFLEDFSITLGGRYLDYEIEQFKEDWGLAFGNDSRATANIVDANDSDDEIHGRLTTTWRYAEASQVYATVSNSTRPGGFNRTVPVSDDPIDNPVGFACKEILDERGLDPNSFDAFGSDEVTNYEFGWKADLSDRLRFNGAVYYIEWEDIQQSITLAGDCGVNLVANAGDAESQGAELEMTALVTDNFTVSIAAGYTDAELSDDVPDAGIEEGDQLPDVPEWTANITLDYVYPVSTGEFFAVANYNYVDDTLEFIGDANDDVSGFGVITGNEKPSYDIVDLRLGFTSEDNWEWLIYVDNVTDEEAIYSYSDALAFNLDSYDRTVRNRPRTFGTSFTYNF